MKKILLSLTFLFGSHASFAQLSCANPIAITTNGTIPAPAITGTYVISCNQDNQDVVGTTYFGVWYTYTAPSNGIVKLSSNLPTNVSPLSVDTRVSVWQGSSCTALTCIGGNDDLSASNYRSAFDFNVTANSKYYIQWDSRYSALGFNFTFEFTPVTCFPPSEFTFTTAPTTTTAGIGWTAPTLGTPAGYQFEYGVRGFFQGTGTVINNNTPAPTNVSLTGLLPSTVYDFYIRTSCGASDYSSWVGPITFNTTFVPTNLPYTTSFEDTFLDYIGWDSQEWGVGNATSGAQNGTSYAFVNSSTTAATNALLFSRAISLQANEQVTLTFYTRLGAATGNNHNLKVWVNGTPSAVGATQLGTDITITGAVYALQTRTFTATAAGTYYFIFNNTTPIVANVTSLRLDTVNMTSVLGTNDFLSSNFSVFPNPVKNVINFSNNANAVVSLVEMSDLNGRVVKTVNVNATEGQISVSDLATGMYMMKITTDQGVAVKKIVKQ